ncbi:hypothetical protein F5X99DRAFT_391757 [Biscogniauxia marginata]|nr:hypothetical protein F5X99DRAFT_391757 [Biscogniauxia marginata]
MDSERERERSGGTHRCPTRGYRRRRHHHHHHYNVALTSSTSLFSVLPVGTRGPLQFAQPEPHSRFLPVPYSKERGEQEASLFPHSSDVKRDSSRTVPTATVAIRVRIRGRNRRGPGTSPSTDVACPVIGAGVARYQVSLGAGGEDGPSTLARRIL